MQPGGLETLAESAEDSETTTVVCFKATLPQRAGTVLKLHYTASGTIRPEPEI
jgi:hypothetical protein